MDRRHFNQAASASFATLLSLAYTRAHALSLGDLTNAEASQGLKTALEKGALAAVALLGKTDGFLGNDKVRIPLPGFLEDAAKLLKTLGQGKRVDELLVSMNRAAETAVPMAKDLLVGAVKSMSVSDAKKILSGGDTSVTGFFAEKTREPLGVKFLPVVTKATEKVGPGSQVQPCRGQGTRPGTGQEGRRQHPAVRHPKVTRWPVLHDWRRRKEDPPRPCRHGQRPAQEGLWCLEVGALAHLTAAWTFQGRALAAVA